MALGDKRLRDLTLAVAPEKVQMDSNVAVHVESVRGWRMKIMTSIQVFLEYDNSTLYSSDSNPTPFCYGTEVINFTGLSELTDGKDYLFIAAISGHRNHTGIAHLYPSMGLPEYVSPEALEFFNTYFEPMSGTVSWLTLPEILGSLDHMRISRDELSLPVNLLLEMMTYLDSKLGSGKSRLLFGID